MKNFASLCGMLSACASTTVARADAAGEQQAIVIPLKQVWAYEMPGTIDVRQLEPDNFGEAVRTLSSEEQARHLHASLTMQIKQSLRANTKKAAGPCFVVVGTGEDALKRAYEVLVQKKEPLNSFRSKDQLSVVFYSYQYGQAIHLRNAIRRGNVIEIQYAFVPHRTLHVTAHLALIPIGRLPPGTVEVHQREVPHEQSANKLTDRDIISRVICDSCKFTVTEN